MGWLRLPSEKGSLLNEAECEALFAWFRAPVSKTIVSDVLTVEGTGRYTVLPQSSSADQITSIVVSQESVNGCLIELAAETGGHTITLVHSANLRLMFGNNVELSTIYTTIWLRHRGSNVWSQALPLVYVP